MLQTVRVEKVDEKMKSFVEFPCYLIDLWSLNCLKSVVFLQNGAEFSKKSKSNRQFTYMHLKGLVMHFQEIVLFIML